MIPNWPQPWKAHCRFPDHESCAGTGVRLIILDRGWNYDHLCYRDHLDRIVWNTMGQPMIEKDHGTAVLGIATGTVGCLGLVPEATIHVYPSTYAHDAYDLVIERASHGEFGPGDVFLVEANMGIDKRFPFSSHPDFVWRTQKLLDMGITVVELAGNENLNMESLPPPHPDSIIVGSGWWDSAQGIPRPTGHTNWGSRIDVCAPGKQVVAPGYGDHYSDDDWNHSYTLFNGTSCASAIVACACAAIQSRAHALGLSPLSPKQIRSAIKGSHAPIAYLTGSWLDVLGTIQILLPSPDSNLDGKVDTEDFFRFADWWCEGSPNADLDRDGKIGWGDVEVFLKGWTG